MILTRIEITNYKQYGGHHVIEIPQSGAIGVIGANGVGKTTLFEAIEWALYSPSSLKSADVKPRVWRGKTEVKVTLDDPVSGGRFIVERELGKGSAKAQIYRVDQFGFEEKIVDGATQVTSYVTNNLIGLEHSAFVATFFTRQKELGFFNGSPTARRREVGKLLGLETIREAQQLIAEDRKRAQADARSYQSLSESQARDRDFPAEIAAAGESITQAEHTLKSAAEAVHAASEATIRAEKSLADSERVREHDSALAQRIMLQSRDHDIAKEQETNANRNLKRLATLETERQQLLPTIARLETLENEEREHEAARARALRKREIEQHIVALERRDKEATASIREEMQQAPAPDGNVAWNLEAPDKAVDWAATIDLAQIEQRAAAVTAAVESNVQLGNESRTLTKYLDRVAELREVEHKILESGDPQSRIQELQNRLQELNGSIAAANNSASRIKADYQKTERVLMNLRSQQEGEICPTCQRPFTSEDTTHVISVFERELQQHQQHLREIDGQINTNKTQIASTQTELQKINELATELTKTRAALDSGNRYVQEQQAKVDACAQRLQEVLRTLEVSEAPTADERDRIQRELIAWRKVVEAGVKVSRALRHRAQIAIELQPFRQELGALVEVTYSEAQHREVTGQVQVARQAKATIERIDGELANRDEVQKAREIATKTMLESQASIHELRQDQAKLAFSAESHQQLQIEVRNARAQQKLATEEQHRADIALREAESRRAAIVAEQERIERLAKDAEAKQREADDLDLMYKEFTEFERFAAAWYAPRLSEIASDLVAQVTDGKYDRVEFDNNFSIEVYDGDDEKFPYETFSGGERDAIALCARIALSRVIGGASSNPPGFLVLDEVFGSLDLERRQRLLEMLAAITGADDHFRQVFIISHVDDVRTSPILDDIWRVTETDDGTSELQPLGVGVDIGEL